MKLTKNELRSFALAELNSYELCNLNINSHKALKEIEDQLYEEIQDLNSKETKVARLNYLKVKNAKADDYAEKLLKLDGDRKVIYGIRNKGGNPDLPFVQLRANFQITSKKESLDIYEKIKNEFKVFKPLFISFYTKQKIDADFYGSVHMVSKVESICSIPSWPQEESISFENITDDSYYHWYKNGYDEFHADVPELKNKVTVNSSDSMEDSLEQGLLKYVLFSGERIGLIAGEKSDFLASSGVYFHEIFISKNWKGKGLAKAVQRKFIENFCDDLEYVWGTIDSNNFPSFKTAYSNGRRPVMFECFVNL